MDIERPSARSGSVSHASKEYALWNKSYLVTVKLQGCSVLISVNQTKATKRRIFSPRSDIALRITLESK